MAYQDFTTYTEADPNAKLTVTSTKVDIANIRASDEAYVYKDAGVDHFSGDFEHLLEVYVGSATTDGINNIGWALTNSIETRTALVTGGRSGLMVALYDEAVNDARIVATEYDSGVGYSDGTTGLARDTLYYIKIKRDEAVGTYGTLYVYTYSDSGRTTLIDTASVALHTSKKDFRYLYGYGNDGRNIEFYFTGYTQNLDIQEGGTATPYRRRSNLALLGVS